jgi:hypothetical protein
MILKNEEPFDKLRINSGARSEMLRKHFPSERLILLFLMFAFFLFIFSKRSFAQAEAMVPCDCRIVIAPYIWMVNTTGDHTIGSISRPVDIKFNDIFNELKFAAAAYFEVHKKQWIGGIEFAYLNFGTDSDSGLIRGNRFKNYTTEVFAGYGLTPLAVPSRWELIGGLRYTRQDLDFNVAGNLPNPGFANDWFDPFVGIRYTYKFGAKQRWQLSLRGDLGGVLFGSAFTAQALGHVGYRFSRIFDAKFGVKYYYVDYESGELGTLNFFAYKANQVGLLIRSSPKFCVKSILH